MQVAPLRDDEAAALAALQALQVLDSEAEAEFDALVQAASAVCQAPVSLISLVDADRQWFKAGVGLPGVTETPRDLAFCAHAVLGDAVFEVPDTAEDDRFADNPLVLGDPGIRFYAGAPLRNSAGQRLGTLCVIDRQPRRLSDMQRETLRCLARAVMLALERRQQHGVAQQAAAEVAHAALVLRHSPDAIVGIDRDGAIRRWNPAAERLFGHAASAVTGRPALALLAPDHAAVDAATWGLAEPGQPQSFDLSCRSATGEARPVALTWVPEHDAAGRHSGATLFLRDLRAHHLALRRLAASESRWRALSDSSPLGIFHVDGWGACTYVNERWRQIFGLSPDESLGTGWTAQVNEPERSVIGEAWRRAAEQGSEFSREFEVCRRDGSRRQVLARARPVADEPDTEGGDAVGNRRPGFVGTVEDVTERRALLARLADNDERLRRLYEATPAMLHSMDEQGRILVASDAWLARLGYPRGEVIGRPVTDFMTPASRARAIGELMPKLLTTGRCDGVACEFLTREGALVEVLASAVIDDRPGRAPTSLAILDDVSLRRQAERRLEEERQRLKHTIDGTRAGTWEWNVRTGQVRLDKRSVAMLGYRLDELGETTIQFRIDHTHPDDHASSVEAAARHFAGLTDHYESEARIRHRDGHWVWIQARGGVMTRGADGKPEWMFGTHLDISARKALERELQDQQRFLRQVLDNVPALIAYIDLQRRYAMVNQAYVAWSQRAGAEIVGRSLDDVHGVVGHALLAPHLDLAMSGTPVAFEADLQRGAEVCAMQVTYVPDRDERGQVIGVISMKVDVTPLRRTEQRLRVVMESSPLGMFVSDRSGRCLFTNSAWQRIAGMDGERCLGDGWVDAIHPDDRERLADEWRQALASGSARASEHRYRRPDGTVVWVRGYVAPTLDGSYAAGAVGTVEDITERRQLDLALVQRTEELKRSNEDLERFAYVASHDLQEPLRMVTSYGQLLVRRHRASLPDEAREFLDFMVDGGQRAQALIRDLLSLARVDSQARPWQPVDLQTVLADTLRQLKLRIDESGATVTHDGLPTVMADARQMGQLMANLVGNALKFRGAQPAQVHVGAERVGQAWRISVRDNGMGIEPRFFERIFVMFQRLHLRTEHEGTGIGLAICKKIVERHGGRIGVQSAPGQGATFHFTLPDQGRLERLAPSVAVHATP